MWKFAATWQAGHMDGSDTIKINSKNLHENGVQFPEEQKFITNCYKINIKNIMIKRCVTLKMNCANLIIGLENVLTLSSSNQ